MSSLVALSCLVLLKLLLVSKIVALSRTTKNNLSHINVRSGQSQDLWPIALSRARNFQNPLGIQKENLLVAINNDTISTTVTSTTVYPIVGWAEIRPLGYAQRDPQQYDSRPGSYDLEEDVDDQMWEEFMDDSIQVPTGWASLPWTKEYQAMEAGIAKRQARREALVQHLKRRQRELQVPTWTIQSLFVEPYYRGQGIGSELIRQLCAEYQDTGKRLSDLYVVTRNPEFYQRFGFAPVNSRRGIPLALKPTTDEVCMKGTDKA